MSVRGPMAALLAAAVSLLGQAETFGFPDCNQNGIDDVVETETVFSEISVGAGWQVSRLADLDGDGDLDLVGGSPLGVSWRENLDGAGTFGSLQTLVSTALELIDFVPADFDGDGDLDLVVGAREDDYPHDPTTVSIYDNLGGTFGPALEILRLTECGVGPPTLGPLEVGDRDTDGDLDVFVPVVECSWGRVVTLLNDGTGDSWTRDELGDQSTALAIADVNGDAANDLLIGGTDHSASQGELRWYEGPGDTAAHQYWCRDVLQKILPMDADGDGDEDVVAARYQDDDDDLAVYANVSGLGHFFETEWIASLGSEIARSNMVDGDLDGDGDRDLVWGNKDYSGAPVYWSPNVHGAFEPPHLIGSKPGFHPASLDAGDVDGDGDLDVFVTYCWGSSCYDDMTRWLRNDGDDCNGDRVPDECEADCNANGIADACDLRGGASVDCDGNGIPDECDDAWLDANDTDGDGCRDGVDSDPDNEYACGDSDADGCDDCSGGVYDPLNDGTNGDSDGVCDLTDCDPLNNEVWTEPLPATGLSLAPAGPVTRLTWTAPEETGGIALPQYDVLRSTTASDFLSAGTTVCLGSDIDVESRDETETPEPGDLFHYLIRVENDCPGEGAMGASSDGVPRAGLPCAWEPPASGLVVNEVDYVQPGTSTREFVELFNPSDAPVSLRNLVLITVSRGHQELARVSLAEAAILPPGGYLVVASSTVVVHPDAEVILFPSESGNMSWAGGGVALFDLGTNTLLDALSFRGAVTGITFDGIPGTWDLVEGDPTPWTDVFDAEASMVRYSNGQDFDDASLDWRTAGPPTGGPTPGSANTTAW